MSGNNKRLILLLVIVSYLIPMISAGADEKWRTAYYANQEPFASMLPISEIPWNKYTHIIQGFILPGKSAHAPDLAPGGFGIRSGCARVGGQGGIGGAENLV